MFVNEKSRVQLLISRVGEELSDNRVLARVQGTDFTQIERKEVQLFFRLVCHYVAKTF